MKSTWWWLLLAVLIVGTLVGVRLFAGRNDTGEPGKTPPTANPDSGAFRFREATREAGILFRMTHGGSPREKRYAIEADGCGLALLDYDGDGLRDLYFLNGTTLEDQLAGRARYSNALYRNRGDGTFEDVTVFSGLGDTGWAKGVAIGDYDNDGDSDVFITNFGPDVLYRNNGDGTFSDVTLLSGIDTGRGWTASAAFGDYDADGWLDLYVTGYAIFDPEDPPVHGKRGLDCSWRGVPTICGPGQHTPTQDYLFRNLGGHRFRDVSEESGIRRPMPRRGQGVVFLDLNDDRHPEIYVANDWGANFVFWNQGDGTFVEVGRRMGGATDIEGFEQGSMGVGYTDPTGEGHPAIFVTNFQGELNTLYKLRDGVFEDRTRVSGLTDSMEQLGWGTLFEDFDQDGVQDLIVVNGHVYPGSDQSAEDVLGGWGQQARLYRGFPEGNYRTWAIPEGDGLYPARPARGLVAEDLDGDGDRDLLLSVMDSSPALLWNESETGHWIAFALVGANGSNRDAFGARVLLKAGGRPQVRWCHTDGSYESATSSRLHFGLGAASLVDEVEVWWPSGKVERFTGLAADRNYRIIEGRGKAEPTGS